MRHHARAARTLVAILVVSSCGGSPAEPADGPIAPVVTRDSAALFQTDSLGYTMRTDNGVTGDIGVSLTNRTTGPLYIVNCSGSTALALEKRVDGRWLSAWSAVSQLCLSPPIIVPVGGTYRTRVYIHGAPPETGTRPQWLGGDVAGEYRLVWQQVLSSYDDRAPFGEQLPLEARVSNRFTMRTQAP
jgi:hypothetical protein